MLNKEYIRLIIKNSDLSSQVPFATGSTDDFQTLDILESELFWNGASRRMYSRSNDDIVQLMGRKDLSIQSEINSNVTVDDETNLLILDTSDTAINVFFTPPSSNKILTIKKVGSNDVTFSSAIDGDVNYELTQDPDYVKLYFNITWKRITQK
jgi:hypothetical protein